jgi:hypothetical protein
VSRTEQPSGSLTAWSHSGLRDRVHTTAAALLSKTVRPLWYAESLVLSARYQQYLASSEWARNSVRHGDRNTLWAKAAEPLLRATAPTVLEFGVADGHATRWWAERAVPFAAWHGFDTFEGLPADWVRGAVPVMAAGVFKPRAGVGAVPQLDTPYPVEWHRGLIEETLPRFERPDTALFVLIDVDLLEPTSTILDWLQHHGRPGDLVYFDEAFDPWNEGEAIRRAIAGGLELRAIAHTGSSLLVRLAQQELVEGEDDLPPLTPRGSEGGQKT